MRCGGGRKRECEPFAIGADSRQGVGAARSRCKEGGRSPEEASRHAGAQRSAGGDIDFHDSKIGGQVIELLATPFPGDHASAAIVGYSQRSIGLSSPIPKERPHINFKSSRFVRQICDKAIVWRNARSHWIKRGTQKF